jgi:hypothetical protein
MLSSVSHVFIINSCIILFDSLRKIELFLKRCSKGREMYSKCKFFFAFLRLKTKGTHEDYDVFLCQHTSKIHYFKLNNFVGYNVEGHV